MEGRAIVDTGFLVALLNRRDDYHAWASGLVPALRGPWLTAEACISEATFLLEEAGRPAVERLFQWMEKELLLSRHFLPDEVEARCLIPQSHIRPNQALQRLAVAR